MLKRIISLPAKQSFFLFGPRQTGKSTLIHKFLEGKKSWEINLLETDILFKYLKEPWLFREEAIYKIEKDKIKIIFIDEIQKTPMLLDEVQALLQKYPHIQFILTGSSARKLKRGGANLLAGRLLQRSLFPFSFEELGDKFDLNTSLLFGTLPPLFGKTDKEKADILNAFTGTYLREEIQAEGIVRNLAGFSRFLDIAAAQNGELVNYSSIARDAGLPVRTVQSYYEILEDTLLSVRLDGWRRSIRKRLVIHPRYYFFDTGVSNSLCGRLLGKPDVILRGRLFEQWVVLETIRILAYSGKKNNLFYYRTSAGAEVDMLIERGGKIMAACEIKASKKISKTDISGLKSFREENPSVPLFIIADVAEPYLLEGVEVLPWKIFFSRITILS